MFQFHRLEQQEPALRRQIIGQMGAVARVRPDHRHVDRIERLQTPLAGDLEPPDRFDLVAEKLHADRLVPIGSENVDDASPNRELAGQLHGRGVEEIVLHEPFRQRTDGHRVADP